MVTNVFVWIYGAITWWILSFPFLSETRLTEELFTSEWILIQRCTENLKKRNVAFIKHIFPSDTVLWQTWGMFRDAALTGVVDNFAEMNIRSCNPSSKTVKSSRAKWHKHSLLHNAENLSTAVYIHVLFHYKKWFFLQYKNHVKSSVITKRLCLKKCCLMSFFWMKIKALNIALKPLCCWCSQEAVKMWILLGFWGQRSSPIQTVQGLWHLTTRLPTLLSVQQRKNKQVEKLLQSDE